MQEQNNMGNQEYVLEIRRTVVPYLLFGMINCIGVVFAGKPGLLPGLMLGIAAGVVYFLMMSRRVKKSAELSVSRAVWHMRIGWIVRFGFVIVIFIVSFNHPHIDIWATFTGFFLLHVVIVFNAIVMALKQKKGWH